MCDMGNNVFPCFEANCSISEADSDKEKMLMEIERRQSVKTMDNEPKSDENNKEIPSNSSSSFEEIRMKNSEGIRIEMSDLGKDINDNKMVALSGGERE